MLPMEYFVQAVMMQSEINSDAGKLAKQAQRRIMLECVYSALLSKQMFRNQFKERSYTNHTHHKY